MILIPQRHELKENDTAIYGGKGSFGILGLFEIVESGIHAAISTPPGLVDKGDGFLVVDG